MNENKSLRQTIRKGSDQLLSIKPFAVGMYGFVMVMISYYSRVREKLKIDYDSFMIIQTVVSHSLYQINKKTCGSQSYFELEGEWEKLMNKNDIKEKVDFVREKHENYSNSKNIIKLTISSICLVTSLPKETVRRKVNEIAKKNLIKISKKEGILLGSQYNKVFQDYVPETVIDVSKLIKSWEKNGVLKSLLNFNS